MLKSDTINELAAALAKAQSEMRNPAFDATNPAFRSKFASLAAVRDAVVPPLAKHGLAVTQLACNDEQGRATVETVLMHSSGQWIGSRLTVPTAKADAHGAGSAITYARRYALMALVGVVGDEDDDGNHAAAAPTVQPRKVAPDLAKRASAAAAGGVEALREFWKGLSPADRAALEPGLNELKAQAEGAMVSA